MEKSNSKKNAEYYRKFYDKNHDKIVEKQKCEHCGGSFTYFTKSQHRGSLKCILARDGVEAYLTAKRVKLLKM